MSGHRGNGGPGGGPSWADWAEPLRPDELTRRRLHNRVMSAAEAMLGAPRRSWQDETVSWSTVLMPIAAGLAVAFGMLAYRVSAAPDIEQVAELARPSIESRELHRVFGNDVQAPPALLIDATELDRAAVLSAALVSR